MPVVVGTNSYISVADASTYFDAGLNGQAWDAIDSDTQAAALVTATRMLDRQTWIGLQTATPQVLMWPRTGVVDKYGQNVNSATVPQQIIDACCELALAIQSDETVETNKNTVFNTKVLKAGSAEIQYFRPLPGGRFPTIIQELIGQFLSGYGPQNQPFVSGNCDSSHFDDKDNRYNYDTIRGF